MTIRYPQKYSTVTRAILTERTTYTFSGVKSGTLLSQIKLLRVTPAEARAAFARGDIYATSGYISTLTARMSSDASANQWSINMDSTPNGTANGWYFIKTTDNNGAELVDGWEFWWPKETSQWSYYDLNQTGTASTLLTFDRWPGNFTAVENDDHPSAKLGIQNFQEVGAQNITYQTYSLYDAWLKSRGSSPLDGNKNTISGVELVVMPARYTTAGLNSTSEATSIRNFGTRSGDAYTGLVANNIRKRTLGNGRQVYYQNLGFQTGTHNDPDTNFSTGSDPRFYDTRVTARAQETSVKNFPSGYTSLSYILNAWMLIEQWVDRQYRRKDVTGNSLMPSNSLIPLYWDGSSLKRMSYADIVDTFIVPTLETMMGFRPAAGEDFRPYTISASSSIAGYYPGVPVHYDTTIDQSKYQYTLSGGQAYKGAAAEARDQPKTITTYRLFTKSSCAAASTYASDAVQYVAYDDNGSLVGVTTAQLSQALLPLLNYHMTNDAYWSIRYNVISHSSTSYPTAGSFNRSTAVGATVIDKALATNSADINAIYYGGTDDYRTQTLPNQNAALSTYGNTSQLNMYAIPTTDFSITN
jgi:hypothetical protein